MELKVKFDSDRIPLAGTFYTKDRQSGRVPGIVLAHGFAGARYPKMAAYLAELGYGVLAFDFRGYGSSGGKRGWVIPAEQVVDVCSAVTWLCDRPEIDHESIGVVGSSLGGSIAIMATARDKRIKACVAGCPLGHGDSPMRMQYDTDEKFDAFLKNVEEKKRKGELLHRFEIVFIPERLRGFLPEGTPMEFSPDTVGGFLAMQPMKAVSQIAPRPLLIIHAKDDHVVPVKDAEELAEQAGGNCELEIIEAGDHFIFGMQVIIEKIGIWLQRELPPDASAAI
jgi:fermentation-respiration switch protein FrsA (DUF1100 family)